MGGRPRWWKAESTYTEVKKCIDDMFLLLPTAEVRNIIGACMGRALAKYPVKVFWVDANLNHLHRGRAPIKGQEQNMSEFDRYFFSLLTREINRLMDRRGAGTIWAGKNRVEECVDDGSIEQQLFYAATNLVKDGQLSSASQNKGMCSYHAIASGCFRERFTYVDWTEWFQAGGKRKKLPVSAFVKNVTVKLSKIPPWENKSNAECATLFRKGVRALEESFQREREIAGRGVRGDEGLSHLNPRSRPSRRKERTPQPLCHASSAGAAKSYQVKWKDFLKAYRAASIAYLSGDTDASFPAGSYKPPRFLMCGNSP